MLWEDEPQASVSTAFSNSLKLSRVEVKVCTTHNLKSSFNIGVNRPRTELGRSLVRYQAALSWDILPDDVKVCFNLSAFKSKLKDIKSSLIILLSNRNGEFNCYDFVI